MKLLPILFLLSLSVNYAIAEDSTTKKLKKYDVEIIIFEDANARYINSETWKNNSISETNTTTNNSPKRYNSASHKTIKPTFLASEYKRIKNSSEYNVLQYSAWRQTGLSKLKAYNIKLDNLKNNHKRKSNNSISGDLKVVLARYLHFYSDLEYRRQNANENNVARKHKMKTHRRMRSKELHYIDHPLVGILIQINPVKN